MLLSLLKRMKQDQIIFARVTVPKRSTSQRMRALGLFPGAVVVRGKDWSYGTQDGNFLRFNISSLCGYQTIRIMIRK